MQILLASEFFHPSIGGVQEVMRQLGRRLAKAGHQVVVATSHMKERQSLTVDGMLIEEFRVSGNLVSGMVGEVDRYREYILRQDYDLLMVKAAQQWTFDALIPILCSIAKPKVFVPCGFSGLLDPKYAQYFREMPGWLREFDRLVFYASDYRDINLARSCGLRNMVLLSNGADEEEFNRPKDPTFRARHGIPAEAFLVMTVGTLTGMKGHLELAQAFELCQFSGRPAYLMLIGNRPRASADAGWLSKTVVGRVWHAGQEKYRAGGMIRVLKWVGRRALERLGLGGVLTLLGYRPPPPTLEGVVRRINAMSDRRAVVFDLPRTEVVQAYLNSDLFVFASRVEYSPLVLFEASAAGLPFISVPVGNAAEIAGWTGGGMICDAELDGAGHARVEPSFLARKIEYLASNPALRTRLGAEGRRRWRDSFSWSAIARKYESVFKQCIQEKLA